MKHVQHYTNVIFALLLIASLTISIIDRDMGIIALILITLGWVTTQIVKNAVVSIATIIFGED